MRYLNRDGVFGPPTYRPIRLRSVDHYSKAMRGVSWMVIIFMFPGQSSRYPGMFDRLMERYGRAREMFATASDILGRDLFTQYDQADGGFDTNQSIQVGVFLANAIQASWLSSEGITPTLSLGLSLGEYNHLVDIGAVSFETALRLVDIRGQLYDQGPAGKMAAISVLSMEELLPVVAQATRSGVIEIANINAPTQHVIAGEAAAVDDALQILEADYYVPATVIEQKIPMHTSLFRGVAAAFAPYLGGIDFKPGQRPYISNHVGGKVATPDAMAVRALLEAHVHSPVLWRQCIEGLATAARDSVFIEVGPRSVLTNLLARRWLPNQAIRTDCLPEELPALLAQLRRLGEGCPSSAAVL
jgi:[acyl-carrier-protein] S-malonyltransferase